MACRSTCPTRTELSGGGDNGMLPAATGPDPATVGGDAARADRYGSTNTQSCRFHGQTSGGGGGGGEV